MDLRIVWTITTLLLMTAESDQTPYVLYTETPETPVNTQQPNSTTTNCSCPSASPAAPADPKPNLSSPAVGLLTISWTGPHSCTGDVHLNLLSQLPLPVCYERNTTFIESVLTNVCENKKGCTGKLPWSEGRETLDGYDITKGEANRTSCKTLKVKCKGEDLPDVEEQLRPYKVAIALLCCVLLAVILIRFTRPTIKALQKRLSERRENRWVGPTQSHSVSYHRGKSAVKTNDGEKRFSYPALERLAVNDSREPSSNRNSDYNF